MSPKAIQIIRRTVDGARKEPDPATAARTVARSVRITGEMLEEMAEITTVLQQASAWVYWTGNLAWGIVEVAVPGSFWRIFLHHWTRLLFALGVFLTAIGFLPWAAGVQSIGIALLAITCVVEALTLSLNYWMRSKSWMRPLLGLIAILGAAGAIYFARGLERSGTPAHHLGLVFCFAIFVTAWAGLAAAWLMRRPTALWGGLTILIGVAAALEIARNAFWYIGYYQAHPETVAAGWMVPTELALIGIAVFVAVSGTPLALLLRGVRSMNRRREALSVTGGDS
jgi:hypothetical protein